jgi:iron complex outermembrane receptor protein
MVYTTDTNTDVVQAVPGGYQAFGVMDLTVGYRVTRRLTAHVNVDNMADNRYWTFYRSPGRVVLASIRIK